VTALELLLMQARCNRDNQRQVALVATTKADVYQEQMYEIEKAIDKEKKEADKPNHAMV